MQTRDNIRRLHAPRVVRIYEALGDDAVLPDDVGRGNGQVEALFRQALEAAREHGELAADKDPAALAAFIMTSIWGLRVLLAAGADPQRVQTVVDQLLCLLD